MDKQFENRPHTQVQGDVNDARLLQDSLHFRKTASGLQIVLGKLTGGGVDVFVFFPVIQSVRLAFAKCDSDQNHHEDSI